MAHRVRHRDNGQSALGVHLPAFLRTAFAAALVGINTLIHTPILLLAVLLKALVPIVSLRKSLSSSLTGIAESWASVNTYLLGALTPTKVEIHGAPALRRDGRYLVLCNHRSWCDIPVLLTFFNRRAPFLRFFLKQELIWVPVLGLAWWALDYPFMKRHSRAQLARNPALRTQDLDATRAACAKFADIPVSIMNFVEGTRFTPAKHAKQSPPYRHLLRPRAGGVAAVLDAMAGNLQSVLDVTLIYRDPEPSLAALLAGRLTRIELHVTERAVPDDLAAGGDYEADSHYRARCQRWVNGLWAEKDALIAERLTAPDEPAP